MTHLREKGEVAGTHISQEIRSKRQLLVGGVLLIVTVPACVSMILPAGSPAAQAFRERPAWAAGVQNWV